MRAVHPHHDAEEELATAVSFYEGERPGLGGEFWDDAQKIIALIADNPAIGGVVSRANTSLTVRRMPLRRFPYFVIYRERGAAIEIVAFAHMSRRPAYWRERSG
jgi:toxin ParE1/3/4